MPATMKFHNLSKSMTIVLFRQKKITVALSKIVAFVMKLLKR